MHVYNMRTIHVLWILVCFQGIKGETSLVPDITCLENNPKKYTEIPRSCETDPNVKDSSCYLCNNACKRVEELERLKKEDKRLKCGKWIKINCCLLSSMLNKQSRTDGCEYRCYGTDESAEPQLFCPEPVGLMCQSFTCDLTFRDGRSIINYEEEHKDASRSISCAAGHRYRCVCTKTTENTIAKLQEDNPPKPSETLAAPRSSHAPRDQSSFQIVFMRLMVNILAIRLIATLITI
ncbi:uncharacterized protein LOC132746002 isoform X1 [Ruditapes philippinarum]|uniref:uncharacterized protein LOC132746002 isoform X1 n=2 Tax=Ruditapes philippinarum TaxID=129788 RepID=UPI00295B02DE|nr:uncharacterized protein LOC132746002 isoform X1 [Ruditapes philippinarum]